MNLETFSFDIDGDGIAHAVFDVPGRSMNTLTGKAIADIIAITKEVASNDKITGLVLSSGKPSGFCAGADLGEMNEQAGGGKPASEMTEAEILEDFPDLTQEDLKACIAYAADRERRFMSAPLPA